jgi:hypothetical protein
MLLVGGWLRWPGDCSSSRQTALLLGRLLEVLLFTEARSMGRAIHCSPMKPESWSGWFPLKSLPTCSCRWLHCDLQNVPRELLELYVLTGPRHLRRWLTELIRVVSLTALRRTQVKTLLATIYELLRLLVTMESPVYRDVTWIPICVSVTWSPVFPTCGRFPWEAPTHPLLVNGCVTRNTGVTDGGSVFYTWPPGWVSLNNWDSEIQSWVPRDGEGASRQQPVTV